MLNPMRLKDYVTLGNIMGGMASMIAAMEGNLDWACYWIIIAWIFDSFDGAVARATGGGNKFGEVFDNVADLVAYSLAPSFFIYLQYRLPKETGGAGWPVWAAGLLASLPTIFGCIRLARNNVKDIIMPKFHLGLPRTVHAQYLTSLFCSHIFRNAWLSDNSSSMNPIFFGCGAAFIVATSLITFTMRPYHAKPKAPRGVILFSTVGFFATSIIGFIFGLILEDIRIFFDVLFFNYSAYTWFNWTTIPAEQRREVRQYVNRIIQEWKVEMNPKKT